MSPFQIKFLEELGAFQKAPFLFIGSGVSRRYIGAENWEDLLKKFSLILGENYNQLKAGADAHLPEVASALANKMFDRWWTESQFEEHRNKYESPHLKRESCLKIEISEYLQSISEVEPEAQTLQEEINAFSKVVVDGIITTNYDLFLERVFNEYKTYIGQNDLIFSDPSGIGEIYKIHGCCSKPDSLVLTANDYLNFNKRNPYLAAKLLTIFTEHPIIFLGYSVNDPNVRSIIDSIVSCLDEEGLEKLSNRLILVQWKKECTDTKVSSHSFSFDGKAVPYKKIECSGFLEIFEALGSIKRKLSPKLLRHLRECVYDLVKTTEPITSVYVRDIDADTDLENTEVVIGIGAVSTFLKGKEVEEAEITELGYKTYTQTELIKEYVEEASDTVNIKHYQSLVLGTLPVLLKSATHIPIFKYLQISGYLDSRGEIKEDVFLDERILDSFTSLSKLYNGQPSHYISKVEKRTLPKSEQEFSEWISNTSANKALNGLLYIKKDYINIDLLCNFIKTNVDILSNGKTTHKTLYIKSVCLYDFIKYKNLLVLNDAFDF